MRIPGPKWGAGRPPLETPKSRCAIRIGRTPRRLRGWSFGAVGEGRERLRARHGRRTSTASGWGLAPPCPLCSQTGTFAGHARLLGAGAPLPPKVPQRGKSANHARQRMVPRSKRLLRQRLRKSARKLQPRSGEEFRCSLARIAAEGRASATAGGIPKGAQPSLACLCLLSAGAESRGPARPERVEGRK